MKGITFKGVLTFIIIINFFFAGFYLSNAQASFFIKGVNSLELMLLPSKLGMSFGAAGGCLVIVGVLFVIINNFYAKFR